MQRSNWTPSLRHSQGGRVAGNNHGEALEGQTPGPAPDGRVSVVERTDFSETGRQKTERTQSLDGFDPEYTDIVDYIARCTHRIWEEKNVGLIYSHYTHNCVVYLPNETLYDREDVVESTLQRIVTMPDRGMATQIVWQGDDQAGFYTSHLLTSAGVHTEPGPYGPPTGRDFSYRTVADCMIYRNRIFREWLVSDTMAVIRQLELDPDEIAAASAKALKAKGRGLSDYGALKRLRGQYPPDEEADLTLARMPHEARVLQGLHDAFNRRMFGAMRDLYAPNVQFHGPLMVEATGVEAVIHQWMGLFGVMPNASFAPQHVCSVESDEGGWKVAIRWVIEGRHSGYGLLTSLGAPDQAPMRLMGMTHVHVRDDRIVEEWTVYDEMSLLTQKHLHQMGQTAENEAEADD